jgi:hypothetical protein
MMGSVLIPLFLVWGLIWMVFGERAESIMGTIEQPSRIAWILGLALALAGWGIFLLIEHSLRTHGYVPNNWG